MKLLKDYSKEQLIDLIYDLRVQNSKLKDENSSFKSTKKISFLKKFFIKIKSFF